MGTLALAILFLLMIATPCVVAVKSARKVDEPDEVEALTPDPDVRWRLAPGAVAAAPPTLEERLASAEAQAQIAQEQARQAHWTALAAAARAAALRADAAAQVAAQADLIADAAIRAAQAGFSKEYLPESHPSLDFPRSRVRRRAA